MFSIDIDEKCESRHNVLCDNCTVSSELFPTYLASYEWLDKSDWLWDKGKDLMLCPECKDGKAYTDWCGEHPDLKAADQEGEDHETE